MADNRMFLVHVPTGLAVGLAKRYGPPWIAADASDLQTLFNLVAELGGYDEFALAWETATAHALEIEEYLPKKEGLSCLKLKGAEQEELERKKEKAQS